MTDGKDYTMESLIEYIITFGYIALFTTVFAESGLFFGFFLPGDSLLFTENTTKWRFQKYRTARQYITLE